MSNEENQPNQGELHHDTGTVFTGQTQENDFNEDDFSWMSEEGEIDSAGNNESATPEEDHFTLDFPCSKEDPEPLDASIRLQIELPMLMVPYSEIPDIKDTKDLSPTDQLKDTIAVIQTFLNERGYTFQAHLNKDRMSEGDWRQGLFQPNGDRIKSTMSHPAFKVGESNKLGVADSRTAMDIASGLMGVGTFRIVSGGFVVRYRRPKLQTIANLFRRISLDKRGVGQRTGGAGYSNESVYLRKHLVDFIVMHVASSSIKDHSEEKLVSVMNDNVVDEMLIHLLGMIHQNGFRYARACVTDLSRCNHIERGLIDIPECLWIDNSRFTQAHRDFLGKREAQTVEKILEYQQSIALKNPERAITDKISIVMKVPSTVDGMASGEAWISNIEETISEAFAHEPSRQERIEFLNDGMDRASIGAYTPWIEKLIYEVNGEQYVVDDQTAIRRTLVDQAGFNDNLITKIVEAVIEFQAENQLVVWGTPRYKCPKCGKQQTSHLSGEFGEIIPHGVQETFLNLANRWMRLQALR